MSSDEKRPLGKILLQRKLVSAQELEASLKTQRQSDRPSPLASQLIEEGKLDEVDALRALSEQHGVPGIDLSQVAIALDQLDVVPRDLAQNNRILPVLVRGDRIFLAMADPHDRRIVDELEFVTGKKVYAYIALHTTLVKAIDAAYEAKAHGERYYLGPRVPTETLRQLGLAPSGAAREGSPDPPASAAPAARSAATTNEGASVAPGARAAREPPARAAAPPSAGAPPTRESPPAPLTRESPPSSLTREPPAPLTREPPSPTREPPSPTREPPPPSPRRGPPAAPSTREPPSRSPSSRDGAPEASRPPGSGGAGRPPPPPTPRAGAAGASAATPPPLPGRRAAAPPPPGPAKALTEPPRPSLVVDEALETAGRTSEISTSEFGVVGEEVSNVSHLPDDLRVSASRAASALTPGAGKLVLVVDDEEDIRNLLRRLLTQRGHRVLEADRGLLALRLVKDHVPDLIILDAMLPELHGFDIARRIKGSAKYGAIPVIMMSAVYRGWRIAEDLKQNYGIEEYIEKPFRISDVLEIVERLLARGQPGAESPAPDPDVLSAEAEKALIDGVAAYNNGQLDDAIEHLRHGVSIDPLAYRLRFHLALLYGKKGQIYEGIQELERAVDLNPKHFPALKNLAVLYEKAGFKNKAVEMWERCAAAAPDEALRASVRDHLRQLI